MAKQLHTSPRSLRAIPSVGGSGVQHATTGLWRSGNVLWSDESCFRNWLSEGHFLVWWMPEKCYLLECIVPVVKFGGGGIMGWRCFLVFGPLRFAVKCTDNTATYKDLLENYTSDSMAKVLGKALLPKARSIKTWFDKFSEEKINEIQ